MREEKSIRRGEKIRKKMTAKKRKSTVEKKKIKQRIKWT
jgi:hypothetical protein